MVIALTPRGEKGNNVSRADNTVLVWHHSKREISIGFIPNPGCTKTYHLCGDAIVMQVHCNKMSEHTTETVTSDPDFVVRKYK
jgi:hypothetical protein